MWSRFPPQHWLGRGTTRRVVEGFYGPQEPLHRLSAGPPPRKIAGRIVVAFSALFLAACRAEPQGARSEFPAANRDVAPIVGDSFSTEDARDRVGEAEAVIAFAGVTPGMSVADIGAGEGYYTVRLARAVGPRGRVLAEDIVPETRDRLALRVNRENLANVSVLLGLPEDPKLPRASFDRIFLVHMYHEVEKPYEFLWHLRRGLKPRDAPGLAGLRVRQPRTDPHQGRAAGRGGRLCRDVSDLGAPARAVGDQALPDEGLEQAHLAH